MLLARRSLGDPWPQRLVDRGDDPGLQGRGRRADGLGKAGHAVEQIPHDGIACPVTRSNAAPDHGRIWPDRPQSHNPGWPARRWCATLRDLRARRATRASIAGAVLPCRSSAVQNLVRLDGNSILRPKGVHDQRAKRRIGKIEGLWQTSATWSNCAALPILSPLASTRPGARGRAPGHCALDFQREPQGTRRRAWARALPPHQLWSLSNDRGALAVSRRRPGAADGRFCPPMARGRKPAQPHVLTVETSLNFTLGRISDAILSASEILAAEKPQVLIDPIWIAEPDTHQVSGIADDWQGATRSRVRIAAADADFVASPSDVVLLADGWVLACRVPAGTAHPASAAQLFAGPIMIPELPRPLLQQAMDYCARHRVSDAQFISEPPGALPRLFNDHPEAAFFIPGSVLSARLGLLRMRTVAPDPPLTTRIVAHADPFLDRARVHPPLAGRACRAAPDPWTNPGRQLSPGSLLQHAASPAPGLHRGAWRQHRSASVERAVAQVGDVARWCTVRAPQRWPRPDRAW